MIDGLRGAQLPQGQSLGKAVSAGLMAGTAELKRKTNNSIANDTMAA